MVTDANFVNTFSLWFPGSSPDIIDIGSGYIS